MAFPWLIVAAVASVIAGGMAYVEASKAAKDQEKANKKNSGVLINKNSNDAYVPVIYGTRRIGGTRVFVSTQDAANGDPNEFLYIALVLCEGEVESIEDIEIDDVPITDDRFDYTDSITINKHYGTDSQTVDTLLQEANSAWTADHRLRGFAYLAIRLKYNQDAFSGIPNITALVQGRLVYDPRDASTAYSTNMALCLRDYLTNTRYGKGLPSSAIDDDAFSTAADDCDVSVTYFTSGDTGKIFDCNMVLDTGEEIFANVQRMLLGCRGFLPYRQGEYALIIDKSASSEFDFTTDHIIGGVKIRGEAKSEKANRYIVTFINPDASWQEDTAVWPDPGSSEETSLLAEDNGTLLQKEIELETVTNYYAARDFARILTLRSRNALRVSFRATSEALARTVGDIVTITHTTPGWSSKLFQIEEIGLADDGTCEVKAIEYDSSIYTYDTASEHAAYPDTNLPNPFSVEAPTSIVYTEAAQAGTGAVGSLWPLITVSWTPPDDGFLKSYEVQYKLSTASDYFSVPTIEARIEVTDFAVGFAYDFRVRAINTLGARSAWVSRTITPAGTFSALSTTGINAPVSPKLFLTLDEESGKALARVEVSFDPSGSAIPEYFILFYSWELEPNQLAIGTDSGSKLYLDPSNADTGVAGSFTLAVAAGSTTSAINFTDPSGVIDIDLSGQWWVQVDNGGAQTRFHKVVEVSASQIRIPPGETLSFTPADGDTINVIELDWHDSRLAEFKLVQFEDGEIVKHNGINYDGAYYLDVVSRGAEGTSQADQSNNTASYFPALGPGTFPILIDMIQFEEVGSNLVGRDSIDLSLPAEFGWASCSCCFGRKASAASNVAFVRSNIVEIEYAGPV